MIRIGPLAPADRADWGRLAAAYKHFYNTPVSSAEYDEAWRRLQAGDGVHALGAWVAGPGVVSRAAPPSGPGSGQGLERGELVGIVHYLFHTSTWAPRVCYLQDLFTTESARGRGVARALIAAVADAARHAQASRLYWLTQEDNRTARALYDRVAVFKGFVRYDHPL